MTKRELEGQLRRVHPHRARSRRRRRAMAPARRQMGAVLGILFGLGLVALLGAAQMMTQSPGSIAAGQTAAWGRTHKSIVTSGRHDTSGASLFPKRKRAYNPHYDPRSRRAQQRRPRHARTLSAAGVGPPAGMRWAAGRRGLTLALVWGICGAIAAIASAGDGFDRSIQISEAARRVDIVGTKLGMTPDEIRAAITAHDPTMKIRVAESHRGTRRRHEAIVCDLAPRRASGGRARLHRRVLQPTTARDSGRRNHTSEGVRR